MKKQLLLLTALFCGAVLSAKPQLTGNSNKPTTSIFALGETVELTFQAKGLKPGEQTQLLLNIVDENDKPVKKYTLDVKADAKGKWTGKVNPPCGKYGFWRVWGKLADGTELPKVFSRPSGFITYAVVPGEKRYKLYPIEETFWGNHGPSFGYHRMIGLRWGGKVKNMVTLEPKKGAYVNNPKAASVNLFHEKFPEWTEYWQTNQDQLPKWFNTPEYVVKKNGKFSGYTPKGEEYYKKYLEIFAENLEKQLQKTQPFTLIQVTWEPHYPWNFGGTPEDLVRIHKIAYEAVHKRTKHAKLMGPTGTGHFSLEWHETMFKAGLLKYIDVLSIHGYCPFPPEPNELILRARKLKSLVKQYGGGREIPIISNEAGFRTLGKLDRETLQMNGIVRANLILLGEGFKYNLIFYSHDFYAQGYGLTYNLNPRRNFGTDKVSPKPVFPAVGGAALILNGHTSAGAIEYLGDTAWGYAYQRKDGFVTLALWDYSGNPREVEILTGRDEVTLADMMGNTRKVKTQKGLLKLTLTESPVYVIDVNPELWGRTAVKKIQVNAEKIPAVAGNEILLSGKVLALKDGLDGTLIAEFPKLDGIKSISQKMKSSFFSGEKNFALKTVLPKNFHAGDHSVLLKFVRDGVTVASTGVLIQVRPPMELVKVLPAFRNGKPGFRFTLHDLSGKGQKGTLEFRIKGTPESRLKLDFVLKSNETKVVEGFYDSLETDPLKEEELDITLKTADGTRLRSRKTLNLMNVAKRAVGDWNNLRWGTFTNDRKVDLAKISTGKDDLSGKIAFAWNEKYLMFRAVTVDNIYCQPFTGWQTWDGDCIQIGLTKAWRLQETGDSFRDKMEQSRTELDFALTAEGPEVHRTITFDEKTFPIGPVSLKECPLTVTKKTLPDGKIELVYTACIPWRFLNIPAPKKGMILGWGMTANDRDKEKGFKYDLEVFKLKKPELFGAIVLD